MAAPTPASSRSLAEQRYAAQVAVAIAAASAAAAAWSAVDSAAIAVSWLALLRRPLAALVAAQTLAARGAGRYVADVLDALGVEAAPDGALVPARFAGVASDGRPLHSLLYQPAVRALTAIGAGAQPRQALAMGATDLDMIVRTQVADAGRAATGVAVATRPGIGYVRMLNPPSCSRCVILAGRWYRWNQGFERHPRCDCIHIPATEDVADDLRTDPRLYFDGLTDAEQDQMFTVVGARAIRDGADIARVVNARRGMYEAGGRLLTREATTRRGTGRRVRLMPEQIYREARGDRDEAVRLLQRFGYIT